MKFSCRTENLQQAVQAVQRAVTLKTTLPILTGIYITANDNTLTVQATDYQIGSSATIPATVEQPGATVLSSKYFSELVRRLPTENVSIETQSQENTVKINSGTALYTLVSMPADEFPQIKHFKSENKLILKASELRNTLRQTIFSCSTDDSRPIFTGTFFDLSRQNLNIVATDTHRLALQSMPVDYAGEENIHMLVPAKILAELGRILPADGENKVEICWQDNQISFSYDNIYLISRLIEGQFPDYRRVIPNDYATTTEVNAPLFLQAVERASLVTKEGNYNIIRFKFDGDGITIFSNNPDIGQVTEKINAAVQGNDLEISFNAKFVTDVLKIIGDQSITLKFNTPLSPTCIQYAGKEDYTYIITPVRYVG